MKYKQKLTTVEAFQYDGDLMNSKGEYYVPDWAVKAYELGVLHYGSLGINTPPIQLFIRNINDKERRPVEIGEYVVQCIDDMIRSYPPKEFEQMYEMADSDIW